MEGSEFLQRLLRQCAANPAITLVAVDGPHGGPFAELDLYLQGALPGDPPGEVAFSAPTEIITTDGLTIRLRLDGPVPNGAQVLFDRGAPQPLPPQTEMPDLGAFWRDLYLACAAIGRGQALTAHGRLERCREAVINIYRLALSPASPGAGWEGLEALPGADKVLEGLTGWLVQPLDLRAQWRCAFRLAETFEKLMLPLAERLQLPYPWAMRNLAFRRLDETRPDRAHGAEAAVPRLRDLANVPDPPARSGPVRLKVKLRRPPE